MATKLKTDLSTCDDGINDLYQRGMVSGFNKENLVHGLLRGAHIYKMIQLVTYSHTHTH